MEMANLLLIEDMKGVRESLTMVLEMAGHNITTAGTGAEGIQAAQQQNFELVITDILMPEVDGSEVILELKQNSASNVPVLGMSGGGSMVSAKEALRLADEYADEVMQKPFSRDEILSAVDRLTAAA